MIRTLSPSKYCIHNTRTLHLEGTWLKWLVIMQLVKIFILSFWHLNLNKRNVDYFNELLKSESSAYHEQDEEYMLHRQQDFAKKMFQHAAR